MTSPTITSARAPSPPRGDAVSAAASRSTSAHATAAPFARREHGDRAAVADRRVGIVGRARARADDEDPAPLEPTGAHDEALSARASARAECTFSRHVALSKKSRPRSSPWRTASCGVRSRPSTIRAGPRSRILHPLWEWDGDELVGWIATGPTPTKRSHLQHTPYISCSYWTDSHDTCIAECRAVWHFDDETRTTVWDKFVNAPAPVGYDPAIVPAWDAPTSESFAVLRLEPWRLRVFPGTALLTGIGDILVWQS